MTRRRLSTGRRLLFASVATALGLAAVEGAARLLEWASPLPPADARSALSFQQLPEGDLLEHTADADRIVLTGSWLGADGLSVAHPKPPGELRVVLLGGSALEGWNAPRSATFAAMLERLLDGAAGPDQDVRVLNLGRNGYASAQLAWTFGQAAAALEPDLVVTVMGNNEKHDLVVGANLDGGSLDRLQREGLVFRASAFARRLRPPLRFSEDQSTDWSLRDPWSLDDLDGVYALAEARLRRSLGSLADSAAAVGAPLVVSTVPVNQRFHIDSHEWAGLMERDLFDLDAYRLAHHANVFGPPEAGVAALSPRLEAHPEELPARLLTAAFLVEGGDPEAAAPHLDAVRAALEPLPDDQLDSRQRRQLAWALALADPEAARARVLPWVEAVPVGETGGDACLGADLLRSLGATDEARDAYATCHPYANFLRADPRINGMLAALPAEVGAESFDLAGTVASHAPGGVPGWELFLDYCHYTHLGNTLVAHLLAHELAPRLGLAGTIPPAQAAIAGEIEARRGRPLDLTDPTRWAGVDFDVTLLTAEYESGDPRWVQEAPAGEPWEGRLFQGHRETGQVLFHEPEHAHSALAAYQEVLSLRPGEPHALRGLELLEQAVRDQGLAWPLEGGGQ